MKNVVPFIVCMVVIAGCYQTTERNFIKKQGGSLVTIRDSSSGKKVGAEALFNPDVDELVQKGLNEEEAIGLLVEGGKITKKNLFPRPTIFSYLMLSVGILLLLIRGRIIRIPIVNVPIDAALD